MKGRKTKLMTGILAMALTLGLATGCGTTQSASQSDGSVNATTHASKIRVGVMTGANEHFLILEGKEQGIYEKYGLDIEYTEFATGVEAVSAIATGQLDVAEVMDFGLINRLGQTSKQSELRVIAQNYVARTDAETENGTAFYVNPETVSSLDDLKGKRVSVALGTQNEYQNARLYEYAGITVDDITQVPIEGMANVLAVAKNNEIDAVWSSGQTALNLREEGWVPLVSGAEIGLVNRDIAVARDTFAEDTDTLAKYFAARQEIVDYVTNNLDEAAAFISTKTGVTEDIFKNSILTNDLTNVINEETYNSLKELKEWSVANGRFEDFDLDSFISADALKKQLPDNVSYK